MSSQQAKAKQGDQHMLEGDKWHVLINEEEEGEQLLCARTTLFKWSPDWEGAFMAYEKAALSYKAAKDLDKCRQAHLKAADAQCKCNLIHSAARNWEAAAQCARELKNIEEAVQAFQRAASLYSENGTTEKAAEVLTQAARSLEDANPDAAADLLLEAIAMLEQDAKRGAGDAFKRAIALLIRNQRIERAIEVVEKEISFLDGGKLQHETHRSYLTLIILHLRQNDYVAADKAYNRALSCEGFAPSNEGRAAAELLDAFEKGAAEALQACLSRQVFAFLDGPVLRLARSLRVSDTVKSAPSSRDEHAAATDARSQLFAHPTQPLGSEVPRGYDGSTREEEAEDVDDVEKEEDDDENSILL